MTGLVIAQAGPGLTVQDMGRPGYLAEGLSRGGAADRLALLEGAVLLGQSADLAALEMAGFGGRFRATGPLRIALTGAPMAAQLDGQPLTWNSSHTMAAGQTLSIGGATAGVFGYLHLGGGIDTPLRLGSRSTHLTAGLGKPMPAGDTLPAGPDANPTRTGLRLTVSDRFHGGTIRITASAQTDRFTAAEQARFQTTTFTRSPRGNRQGVQLDFDGAPFTAKGGLTILSQMILPGDIQMTGAGLPFVLLPECQTTGGYPRIGTVLPADLPQMAQAAPGARLTFRFLPLNEALQTLRPPAQLLAEMKRNLHPLIRDPHDIADLLGYQLVGGVTDGRELD